MTIRLSIGFFVGWITYIAFWILKDFNGGLEIFTQPIMAAILSGIFVFITYLAGLPIRKTVLQNIWNRIGYLSIVLTFAGIICLIIPERLGLTHEAIHPATEQIFQAMKPLSLIAIYFCIIFPFVNWPKSKTKRNTEQAGWS